MKKYPEEIKIKLLLWLVAMAMFMQMLDGSVLNTALPTIAADFGENPLQMQLAVISYMLSVAIFLPVSGWLSDRFGIKKIFMLAIAGFSIGSLLCAFSNSLVTLSISRLIQGMGGALLVPVGRLAVLKVYPRSQYVKVLSFIVLPALIGPLIGPALGGLIVEYASWHWIFLINIPFGIICFAATYYIMPYIKPSEKTKLDLKGFILFDCAVLLLFMMSASGNFLLGIERTHIFFAAVIFVLLYCVYAKKKKNALFNLDMFKIKSFSVGTIGNLIVRLVGGALPFIAPLFFQTALGFSPSKAGFALLPLGISAMFAKSISTPVILKLGYRRFLILNTLCLSFFIMLVAFIDPSTPYIVILILYAFIGLANSLQFTAINTLSLIDVPDKLMSGANGMMSVVMQISMAMGVTMTALLLEKVSAIPAVAQSGHTALLSAFHLTYIIIGLLSATGALIFIFVPKKAGTYIKDN